MYFWQRNTTVRAMEGFFALAALARKGRATHRRGVAGAGRFTVDPELDLPLHDFFVPGRAYRAYLRHGNVANDDDAGLDIRGAALKLVDLEDPDKRGLDLLMNTGEVAFSTARVFWQYAKASAPRPWQDTPVNERGLQRFLESDPRVRQQFTTGLRRAPESFTGLRYHTQIVYAFKAMDGARRFCRFRLIPWAAAAEGGLPGPADTSRPWDADRQQGEDRPYDYLRQEFRQRLSSPEGVRYRLELQLWEPPDTNEIDETMFDPGASWPEATFPWRPVGDVHLKRRASEIEAEQMWFNLENKPTSLDLIESFSIDDPHSIAWTRIRVYRVSQAVRSGVFWNQQRRAAAVRQRDEAARGTHGLTAKQRRDSSIWALITSHMRR